MTSTCVRAALVEDVPDIIALGQQAVHQAYVTSEMIPVRLALYMLETYWTPEQFVSRVAEGLLLVCEQEGRLVGMTEGAYLSTQTAAMWKLYVHPDAQGQGVGKTLLNGLIARLKPTVVTLYTEYLSQNTRAGDFYASQGFTFDREEHETVAGLNSSYLYVKKLLRSTL